MFPFFQFANSPLLPPPPPRHLRICQRFSVKSFRKRVTPLSCVSSRPGSPPIYNIYYMYSMKQIGGGKTVHVVFKYMSKSGWGRAEYRLPPSPPPNFLAGPWIFLFKDDVIVFRLLGVFFMVYSCR
jgi:hypothetical protein